MCSAPTADAVEWIDAFLRLDYAEDVLGPRWFGGKPEKAHKRRPGLIALVAKQNRPPHSTVGIQLLRNSHQVPHGMLPVRQLTAPL